MSVTNQVLPNCGRECQPYLIIKLSGGCHTFSMPQNLSLPSFRIGPAFASMRLRGVICGAFGSLDLGEAPAFGLVAL